MEFKFVDCMCSFGKVHIPVTYVDYSKEGVRKSLESINVKKAFATHYTTRLSGEFSYNRVLKKELENDDFFLPVYTFNTDSKADSAEVFEKIIVEDNVKMVNVNTATHKFSLDLYSVSEYFDVMDKLKTVVTFSAAGITTNQISEILKVYKNLNVILTNTGFSGSIDVLKLMKDYKNFCVDTNYITIDGIENIVNHFGSERIVFGSYAPDCAPGGYAGRIILSGISDEAKENIAYKNICNMTGEALI